MSTVYVTSTVNIDLDELLDGMAQLDLPELERFAWQVNSLVALRKAPSLPKQEVQALQQINQGIPLTVHQPYTLPAYIRHAPPMSSLADFAGDFWPEDETADDINNYIAEQRIADRLFDLPDDDLL